MITHHHDGHGLNEMLVIEADDRDPDNGNASHVYFVDYANWPGEENRARVGFISFQHGPRDDAQSTSGCTDAALLAIVLDRYEGFQSGPYKCQENALVVTKLQEALHWMSHRADERYRRGVLGKNEA